LPHYGDHQPRARCETEHETSVGLRERLDEREIAELISGYRDGATAASLATALSGCLVPGCAEPSWGPRMWRYEVIWIMQR
jgi:hypothetical protein